MSNTSSEAGGGCGCLLLVIIGFLLGLGWVLGVKAANWIF